MRLDRFLTLYLFSPLYKLLRKDNGLHIPILMYHSISDVPESGHPYYRINTSPKRFYEHMKFLRDNNYKVISLSEAIDLTSGKSQPVTCNLQPVTCNLQGATRNPQPETCNSINPTNSTNFVVLTFDDGYADFYTTAWPILREFNYPVTLYLPTGLVGEGWPFDFKGRPCLTWEEVRELSRSGIEVGSHTVTHRRLYELPWKEVEEELKFSREKLEAETGTPIHHFSLPFAYPADRKWEASFQRLLNVCGYRSCATTTIGLHKPGDNPLCLKRIPVNNSDDLRLFKAKLTGAYNWLSSLQTLYKSIKRAHLLNQK